MKFGILAVSVLMATCISRADESYDGEGFLRDFLVSGPYPNRSQPDGTTRGLVTDFLLDAGGENYVFPVEEDKREAIFEADKAKLIAGIGSVNEWGRTETFKKDATWRRMTFESGTVNTDTLFNDVSDYFVVYAVSYFRSACEREVEVVVGCDDYSVVWLNDVELGRVKTSQGVKPGSFRYHARIRTGLNKLLFKLVEVSGGSGFCVQLLDLSGKPLAGIDVVNSLSRPELDAFARQLHPPRPVEELKGENANLSRLIDAAREKLKNLVEDVRIAQKRDKEARCKLLKSFSVAEGRIAQTRSRNLAGASRSIDEPLEPVSLRRRLCVNGFWIGRRGAKDWGPVRLPAPIYAANFLRFNYPVDRARKPLPAWEGLEVSPTLVEGKEPAFFRTRFEWDGRGAVDFVAGAIRGTAVLRCNGVTCGAYDGIIGEWRVPLIGLQLGENEIELEVGPQRPVFRDSVNRTGVIGDLALEFLPKVCVGDVWIKTGWESAKVDFEAEITNRTDKFREVLVEPMITENGRIRVRLPAQKVHLPANGFVKISSSTRWADPKPWGIGGQYGDPDLYEMVTDIVEDGRIVDRQTEAFGFREFRIVGTEFFLNGRRIVLQGDTGNSLLQLGRVREIAWDLYREDGINLVRMHDSAYWSEPLVESADRSGMLIYAQMYPMLNPTARRDKKNFIGYDAWMGTEHHRWNLANYERWWRLFRNHPSVVIWSTDNEIFTQAWDTAADAAYNVRSDRIGASYEKYMKRLDPSLVLTRDGDLGTLSPRERWFEDPPCDTANFHYPDFDLAGRVVNWRHLYGYRPVIWGETLYCSFGAWDGWIGPVPSKIAKKAERVRRVLTLYREEEVPCSVFMGLGADGYAVQDDTGLGNPWGITASQKLAYEKTGAIPEGFSPREYPWNEIAWPSQSGAGQRPPAMRLDSWSYTYLLVNYYDPKHRKAVRNEIAKAYRELLLPQPPLRAPTHADVLVRGVDPGSDVWARNKTGVTVGVRADAEGKSWFRCLSPGTWRFVASGRQVCERTLKAPGAAALKPGFDTLEHIQLQKK